MKNLLIVVAMAMFASLSFANNGRIPEKPLISLPNTRIQPANPMRNYTPSIIGEQLMMRMWSKMTTKLKDKDCYRRAQIWTWDMFDFFNVKSMKIFIHYTNKFNNELDRVADMDDSELEYVLDNRLMKMLGYNKTWDYHVAPLVLLQNGEYRVLDKSLILAYDAVYPYTDNEAWDLKKRPATIEEWTEGLMIRGELLWKARKAMLERDMRRTDPNSATYNRLRAKYIELGMDKNDSIDIKCHRAQSIAEVDLNHKTAYCFYTIAPMYYYNEIDLRYLAFGNTGQPYHRPVSADSYTEENFINGAENYVQRKWNYSELVDAKKEFKWFQSGDYGDRIKRAR